MYSANSFIYTLQSVVTVLLIAFIIGSCSSTNSDSETEVNFSSGLLGPGDTFSYTFEETGTVPYYCTTHSPDMTGRVRVVNGAEISGQDTVEMRSVQFVPSEITIAPNTTIVWINMEESSVDEHTVKSGNPSQGGNGDYDY